MYLASGSKRGWPAVSRKGACITCIDNLRPTRPVSVVIVALELDETPLCLVEAILLYPKRRGSSLGPLFRRSNR